MLIPVDYTMINDGELADEFCNTLHLKTLFGDLVKCGAIAIPNFFAPLTSSLTLSAGVGVATFTRTSEATVEDFEGLIKTTLAGEPRFQGARRVENLLSDSAVLPIVLGIDGGNVTDPEGGNTAVQLAVSTAPAGFILAYETVIDAGLRSSNSIWLRSDNITLLKIYTGNGDGTVTVVVTNEWKRFGTSSCFTVANGRMGIAGSALPPGSILEYWHPQAEYTTGQTIFSPSEHVDAVKYFETENGNTVAGSVVTEATGAAIPDATLQGVLIEGARTNYFLNSDAPVTQPAMTTGGVVVHVISITGDYTVTVDGVSRVDGDTFTPGPSANVNVTGTTGTIQIEVGSFKSSYIPTTATAATRTAETLSYDNSNVNALEGSIFAIIKLAGLLATTAYLATTGVNARLLYRAGSDPLRIHDGTNFASGSEAIGTVSNKVGATWSDTDNFKGLFVNGVVDGSAALDSDGMNDVSPFHIGQLAGASHPFGTYKNVTLYNSRLTDDQMVGLTT